MESLELLKAELGALREEIRATQLDSLDVVAEAVGLQASDLKTQLRSCHESFKKLNASYEVFHNTTNEIRANAVACQATLEHHTKLFDLLLLPHLADTCARGGSHGEALDLCEFAERAAELYEGKPGAAVLNAVRREAREVKSSLISRLRHSLKLRLDVESALDVAAHLKRAVPDWDRDTLESEFFSGRAAYLKSRRAASQAQSKGYARAVYAVERAREDWSELVETSKALRLNTTQKFHSFVKHHLVKPFLAELGEATDAVSDCGSLSGLWEAVSIFGVSAAEYGLDVRCLCVPIFESKLFTIIVEESWKPAALTARTEIAMGRFGSPQTIDAENVVVEGFHADEVRRLMRFPVLGEFVNDVSVSLNELRRCAFASVRKSMEKVFVDAILCELVVAMLECDEDCPGYADACDALETDVGALLSRRLTTAFNSEGDPVDLTNFKHKLEQARARCA